MPGEDQNWGGVPMRADVLPNARETIAGSPAAHPSLTAQAEEDGGREEEDVWLSCGRLAREV